MTFRCPTCEHTETIEGRVTSRVLCRLCYQDDVKSFMEPIEEGEGET